MLATSPDTPNSERSQRRVIVAFALLAAALLIYRGYTPRFFANPSQHTPAAQLNINTADRVELLQVPGIGPSLADAILSHRDERGPFRSFDELDEVKGIGEKTREKLRPWLSLGGQGSLVRAQSPEVEKLERKPILPAANSPVKKLAADEQLHINRASVEDLQRLPGIGPKLAERILDARQTQPFRTAEDLRRVGGIGAKTVEKLRPHLNFEP